MSIEVVSQVINELVRLGIDIKGPCGAFAISNLVAQRLNLGILYKPRPTENNCIVNGVGYAADIVMDRSGRIWDILFDGGGTNTPVWFEKDAVDKSWYRDPLLNYPKVLNTGTEIPTGPVNNPPLEVESLDWLLRTMHIKMDNMHNELLTKINALQSDNEAIAKALLDIALRQDRPLVGRLFNIPVKLVPE